MSARQWYTSEVIAARHAAEAIEYGLMEAGALGTQTEDAGDELRITGYFEAPFDQEKINGKLYEALRIYSYSADGLVRSESGQVADRDWLAEWKKSWQPVEVGRFIIAPPWLVSEPGAVATGSRVALDSFDRIATAAGSDAVIIRINPGMAFGTGTHETTRLCLKGIEKHYRGGSFLDVGTGTGILAIAVAKCQKPDGEGGHSSIVAYDIDADAIEIAKENAALNEVGSRIDFRFGTIDDKTESADLVCANLTAPVIVELLPALIGATCGRLILSGILDSQIEMIKSRLLELAIVDCEIDQDGEWASVTI